MDERKKILFFWTGIKQTRRNKHFWLLSNQMMILITLTEIHIFYRQYIGNLAKSI